VQGFFFESAAKARFF